jgi:Fe-S cluster assembly protein SufD
MKTLRQALLTRDESALPGRRDEDWRWTDLRGTLRPLPEVTGELQPLSERAELLALTGVTVRRYAAPVSAGLADEALVVKAGETLLLVDLFEAGSGPYVRDTAQTLTLETGAHLTRLVIVEDSAEAVSVLRSDIALAAGATLQQTVIASGARRQRIETRVSHPGQGASVRLDGAYLLSGQRHSDQTTVVVHEGPGGDSSQLIRGVASDQSRGVFQGRIEVREGADGTDARLTHNALMLSDKAEIDAKPELEIYADDVSCAHGNTVGALDEEALFYAQQRGIPEAEARLMLIEAFVGEVVERIGHEALADLARTVVAARLEALRS